MPAITEQNIWFKIAANPKGIKDSLPRHWRCFLPPNDTPITILSWTLNGDATNKNVLPGSTSEEGVDPRAWISIYGDVEITEDGTGIFSLKDPSE